MMKDFRAFFGEWLEYLWERDPWQIGWLALCCGLSLYAAIDAAPSVGAFIFFHLAWTYVGGVSTGTGMAYEPARQAQREAIDFARGHREYRQQFELVIEHRENLVMAAAFEVGQTLADMERVVGSK